MAEFLILTGRRNSLQRLDRTDIPYYHLVCLVESEHERSTLDDINADDRFSVTSEPSEMRVAKQVLRSPDIRIDLKASRDNHAAEVFHVSQVAHSRNVLLGKTAQYFFLLEVVEHDGSV